MTDPQKGTMPDPSKGQLSEGQLSEGQLSEGRLSGGQRLGRVDAHHHLFEQARFPQTWIDDTMDAINGDFGIVDLNRETSKAGIAQTVLVQTVANVSETQHFLDLAAQQQSIAGVVGWADLEDPALDATIASYRNGPGGNHLVGLRFGVQSEVDPGFLDRASVRRGLAMVSDAGLVFDLLITGPHWDAAVCVVKDFPSLNFVLDHLGKPTLVQGADMSHWRTTMTALATCDNVSAKLSGLVTEASWKTWTPDDLRPAVELVLQSFGPNRLMFGSDWPVCLLATDYQRWVTTAEELLAGASPEDRAAIFGGTARRVYGLGS